MRLNSIMAYISKRETRVFIFFVLSVLLLGAILRSGKIDGVDSSKRRTDLPLRIDESQFRNIKTEYDIGDGIWNHLVALNIIRCNGISISVEPPYKPTMFRSPGTSILTAGSYLILGQKKTKYFFLAFFLAAIFILSMVIRRLYGTLEAVCFVLIITFLGSDYYLWLDALSLNSRLPVFFFISLYLLLLINIHDAYKNNPPAAFLSQQVFGTGAVISILMLIRAEFTALPFITVFLLHFMAAGYSFKNIFKIRRSIKTVGLFLAGAAIVLGPWVIRNYIKFDTLSPGGRSGPIIAYKGLASGAVEGGTDYWDFYRAVNLNDFIHKKVDEFISSGGSPDELINLEDRLAGEGFASIKANFTGFLSVSWEEFKNGASFNTTRLKFLGSKEDSFMGHINGKGTFYYFAVISLGGFLLYLIKSPFKTLLLFHTAFYYMVLNALLNAGSGVYVTYVLHLYFAAFSLFIAGVLRKLTSVLKMI